MVRRILLAVGLVVVGLVISVLAMAFASAEVSMSSNLASGRFVMTDTDSWGLGGSDTADTATINTAGYTIVVAPTQLAVDGKRCATIDARTKSVEVKVRNKRISFIADGRLVATYPR